MVLVVASDRDSNNDMQVAGVHGLSGEKAMIPATVYCMLTAC